MKGRRAASSLFFTADSRRRSSFLTSLSLIPWYRLSLSSNTNGFGGRGSSAHAEVEDRPSVTAAITAGGGCAAPPLLAAAAASAANGLDALTGNMMRLLWRVSGRERRRWVVVGVGEAAGGQGRCQDSM
jgi:subtilase family serine protease